MDTQDSRSVDSADLSLDSSDLNSTAPTAAASQTVTLAQIEALLDNPASTRADILSADEQSAAFVKAHDDKIIEIRKRAESETDKFRRKYILLDVANVEALRAAAAQVHDDVRARIREDNDMSDARRLGVALSSSSKKKERFVKRLQGLPAAITDKASHAKQKTVREQHEALQQKLQDAQKSNSESACDALLQEADKLAWVTIEASGELREELLQAFRDAVRTHAS